MSDFTLLIITMLGALAMFALASWKYEQDEKLFGEPRQRFHIDLD